MSTECDVLALEEIDPDASNRPDAAPFPHNRKIPNRLGPSDTR
jgi:hypothetical protein